MFKRAIDLYKGIVSESNNSDDSITQYLVHHNLGLCYRSTREFNNAIYHFKKAIALKPYRPQSWADMGETYCYAGDYFQGHKFQEWKYSDLTQEKRLDWDDPYVRSAVLTRADGQCPNIVFPSDDELVEIYKNILDKVKGAVINVRAVQGLDDVVYASYFVKELLKYEPAKIILSTRLEVLRLFYDLDEKIIVQDEIPTPDEYDYFVPSTALPKLMLDTSTAKKPWLQPRAFDVAFARATINNNINMQCHQHSDRLVGIVWRAENKNPVDYLRSFALDDFLYALNVTRDARGEQDSGNVVLSLQIDAKPDEIELLKQHNIVNLGTYIHDLYAMSSFMRSLNHVITTDTVSTHVAGASGTPCTILTSRCMSDFRWGRTDDTKVYDGLNIVEFNKKVKLF
jgi:tetratricopeptide (TPR) repeat protein